MSTKTRWQASMTVEAALVMPLVLAALAAVIAFGMKTHDLVLGSLVTNEVTERYGHLPEGRDTEELEEYGNLRLQNTISEMQYDLTLEEYKEGSEAFLQNAEGLRQLTDGGFRPEKVMRRLTLTEGILTE